MINNREWKILKEKIEKLYPAEIAELIEELKKDSATASAPLITSLADISGVLIYFSIASWYLGM